MIKWIREIIKRDRIKTALAIKFITFLEEMDALDSYRVNCTKGRRDIKKMQKVTAAPFWISSPFMWCSSPEGGDYWSNLNVKWNKIIELTGGYPDENYL